MELRADAVVIGTGAGGAPAAARLAEAGLDVLILEAGPRLETRDFDGDAAALLPRLMTTRLAADSGMNVYGGACVGGSTVVNDALCWRPPADVLQSWRDDHGLAGLSEASLAPHVDRVWKDLHVTPTDRAHLNRNAYRLELGAARLGWAREPMPRNVRGCANLGLCNLGCPTAAKQSTLLTFIPQAERAGGRVLADTRAVRVVIEAGRVQAVEALRRADPGAREEPVRIVTPLVCVAAGVLETPAVLLRSGVAGRAGQGLQFHTSAYVTARFAEPVYAYYGPTMSYAVSEFSDVNGRAGPGFMIENVTVSEATAASALPGSGAELERVMAALPHLARAVLVLRDRTRGSLELTREGVGRVAYDPTPSDLARLREGMLAAARAFFAADALEVFLPVHGLPPLRSPSELDALAELPFESRDLATIYAVHLFGGAAMAGSPDRGVCDVEGRVFGVNGLYVTDASALPGNTGVNPQITIMANALRIAEGIAAGAGNAA